MKHKLRFLNFLFIPPRLVLPLLRGNWIIIALFIFSRSIIAQETPAGEDKFYIGTEFQNETLTNLSFYPPFYASGMNTILQRADSSTLELIGDYNILAANSQHKEDWIHHYTTGYYSKWEAENQTDDERVGVKHKWGQQAYWKDTVLCWSTIGISEPKDLVMYGPYYRQDKRYKRWLYEWDQMDSVKYVPRFHMALNNPHYVASSENVCKIKVIFTYKDDDAIGLHHDYPFIERTLKVGDFNASGNFDYFYLDPNPDLGWYMYPEQFHLPAKLANFVDAPSSSGYIDWESYTGIQFCVDWLREDTLCTLYIDYVEVYDNNGWNDYLDNPDSVAYKIEVYAQTYNNQAWSNIKHWVGVDEPYSIDCYTPIRIVDSLIQTVNPSKPLIVAFNPTWTWNLNINGEDEMLQFYNRANPKKITLSVNPCDARFTSIRKDDFDWLQFNLQRTSALDPDFWFNTQAHGYKRPDGINWCTWRKPDSLELRSMVMLALAHGTKGIIFKWFDSYYTYSDYCAPNEQLLMDCIVKTDAKPTSLYNEIKINLAPRLTGKLGNTLKNLTYTGNYIHIEYQEQPPPLEDNEQDYLSIQHYGMSYFWHAGLLYETYKPDNKHFLLTNLRVHYDIEAELILTNNTDYKNISFVDIEGGPGRVDTTIGYNSSITYYEEMPKGEGRLYRVSPVIKYGGRLLYPESTEPGMILNDDMIIENGATLTINGDYTAKANIIVKNGSIVNGEDGRIIFENGTKLIIEGNAVINGTFEDKLDFEFIGQDADNGIIVNPGASITLSYCIVTGAETGVKAMVNSLSINIQNVDFIDCISTSINLLGQTGLQEFQRQISFCTITNSPFGISASNLPELVIEQNTITNTDLGINLSNISRAIVFGNGLASSTGTSPGIFAASTGGEIYYNTISGHINGIHLGNSSPDVGSNNITSCLFHAMHIGSGSEPNMQGRIIQNQNNNHWYAVSGYNSMYENGGYEGGGNDNDGSEIYINENANVIMGEGCNSVYDDREPSGSLVNTLLLMNGDNVLPPISVEALYNYWGETEVTSERFGDLEVSFDEYLSEPCPLPDDGEGEMLIMLTSTGEVVDTLYPSDKFVGTLGEIEMLYAGAEKSYITGDYASAENYYDQIIAVDTLITVKKEAYARKYEIGKLLGSDEEYFSDLRNVYLSLAQSSSTSLLEKTFNQLSALCLVGEEEYIPAIGEFDEIIQQNPNTEEAVYAEIDALTTALLIEEADSTLQKGRLGKYLVKSSGDYTKQVDKILRKFFGNEIQENEKELLPTEYTLYQNYPNPFNPTTTIKYDLPNTSDVSLIIYDILGRRVKELVNTKQQSDRYEVQFDASNLASGVYIYQLIADKYISSKKMILLK